MFLTADKNSLKDKKYKSVIKIIILILSSFFCAWVFQYICFGRPTFIISAFFFCLILSFYDASRLGLNIFTLLLSLVYPAAKVFGSGVVQTAALDVVLTTNFEETVGFHEVLPLYLLLQGGVIFVVYLLLIIFNKKLSINLSGIKKIYRCLLTAAACICVFIYGYKAFEPRVSEMIEAYSFIVDEEEPKATDFKILSQTSKYDNYVVIIGESMRSDFMSAYGFPVDTTPFIKKMNKHYISNFISPAPNTTISVPRFLSLTVEGKLQDNNNAVTMAKLAGFDTHWISSQGYSGISCSSAGRVARYADSKSFVPVQNDFVLLPLIEKTLKNNHKKVIFVHIVGSHENPCSKLFGYPNSYKYNVGKVMNCYLATYNKTDELVQKVAEMLKEYSKSYSLAYFADHGLNFVESSGGYKIFRDPEIKQSYDVPFFVVASDINDNQEYKVTRSAFNMIDFYASWFGVKTNLTRDDYDIFRSESDSNPLVADYENALNPYNEKHDGIRATDVYQKMTEAK
ncbi:Phosphoethanolamine transferase for glucans (OPG), alkaline phosphatase superfamily [Succinivibrio dextrinosolvens DSM 3072]|uniref:Phosphoethanolamine transferase for glucans (OPG), alkaline phosphatase superfamily n=1 Tax=Succinivibrio dextrinosolvens DSM 3072 TaxID=1123324 RepID=A0A1T4VBM9_9GAMM|nr:phosphoethanolamine transferase [Succinivibrio dextrinosolvens]SKA62313.1 Phosphoethanolamine transferase for glucans (OPG), alkaline phosphatase superfamily [Succinivibrio dextrinosolvens DSM 3072]